MEKTIRISDSCFKLVRNTLFLMDQVELNNVPQDTEPEEKRRKARHGLDLISAVERIMVEIGYDEICMGEQENPDAGITYEELDRANELVRQYYSQQHNRRVDLDEIPHFDQAWLEIEELRTEFIKYYRLIGGLEAPPNLEEDEDEN